MEQPRQSVVHLPCCPLPTACTMLHAGETNLQPIQRKLKKGTMLLRHVKIIWDVKIPTYDGSVAKSSSVLSRATRDL